jgi:hypothetical protein
MSEGGVSLSLGNIHPSLAHVLFRYGGQPYRFAEDVSLLHVSDLFTLCFRQVYFLKREQVAFVRSVAPKLQMKFEMGRAIEKVVKSWMRNLDLVDGEEVELTDRDLGIVGHVDARLKNGMLLEIKAKDPSIFRLTRRVPLRRDQFQLETYLWMDRTKQGKLLTVTWGDEKNPYRDTQVKYNLKVADLIKKKVGQFREAMAGGQPPDRICESKSAPEAVLCPVRDICFATLSPLTKTIEHSL